MVLRESGDFLSIQFQLLACSVRVEWIGVLMGLRFLPAPPEQGAAGSPPPAPPAEGGNGTDTAPSAVEGGNGTSAALAAVVVVAGRK